MAAAAAAAEAGRAAATAEEEAAMAINPVMAGLAAAAALEQARAANAAAEAARQGAHLRRRLFGAAYAAVTARQVDAQQQVTCDTIVRAACAVAQQSFGAAANSTIELGVLAVHPHQQERCRAELQQRNDMAFYLDPHEHTPEEYRLALDWVLRQPGFATGAEPWRLAAGRLWATCVRGEPWRVQQNGVLITINP
jgi:hypothetical protein